jgi:prephenate dehydrogenase
MAARDDRHRKRKRSASLPPSRHRYEPPARVPAVSGAPLFGKVVVFGVGLIGGSFALALKAAGQAGEIVGFGRTLGSLNQALQLGILDRAGFNVGQEVSNADLVLIATPVGKTRRSWPASPLPGAADGGDGRRQHQGGRRRRRPPALWRRIGQFVPAHPIAGAENSGALAARADLYRQKQVVLTPLPENSPQQRRPRTFGVGVLRRAGQGVGAAEHDRIFAAVSHLPHLLSFALVHELARRDNRDPVRFAASGFRDFTRIAASHPEMWRDICLANRQALLDELDRYRGSSTSCAMPCNGATAPAWKRPSMSPGRRAASGPRARART